MAEDEFKDYYSGMAEMPDDRQPRSHDMGDMTIEYDDNGNILVTEGSMDDLTDLDVFAEKGFPENLALKLDDSKRKQLAEDIDEMVQADIESRKDDSDLANRALELLGIKEIPADEAAFTDACQLTHPVLAEAVVQFNARAMEEFMPATGPVKGNVLGKKTPEKMEKAERGADYMNYHLMTKDKGYYDDTDQMLMKLPWQGTMFRRGYQDPITGEPRLRSVTPDKCHVPYDTKSIFDTPRITYEYEMTENDLRRAMVKGAFARTELTDVEPEHDEADEAEDTSDGRSPVRAEGDNVYTIRESHIEYDLPDGTDEHAEDKEYSLPYIITYCVELSVVLSIRRNWKRDDEDCRPRRWFTVYRYLPGMGFYGWGLLHVIGNAAKAGSSALRALLDAAAGENVGGGFIAEEGANIGDGDIVLQRGVYKKVKISAEDLSKAFHDAPRPQPSTALFSLLEMIINSVRSFASITETVVGEASNNGPVGTTMALIEQSLKVFSGIHKRVHQAAKIEFEILHTLIGALMTEDQYDYSVEGESKFVLKSDFDDEVDFQPVSDPNIWSSTHRISQAQAVYEMVTNDPRGLFDDDAAREAYRRMLEAMRVANIDALLPEKKFHRYDPVSENSQMLTGQPVKAFKEQNHDAHIAVHKAFAQEIAGTNNKDMLNRLKPAMDSHIAEHLALKYMVETQQRIAMQTGMIAEFNAEQDREYEELPVEVENQIAVAAAQQSQSVPPPQPQPPPKPPEVLEAEAKIQRDNEAFQAKQDRERIAFENEERRKDEQLQAEIKRDSIETQADIRHDQMKAQAKTQNESANALSRLMSRLRGGKEKGDGGQQ